MKKVFAVMLMIAVVAAMVSGCAGGEPGEKTGNQLQIALIAMGSTDAQVEAGAMKAAAETGASVISMASENSDPVQQIRDAVSSGCQVLIVASEPSEEVTAALAEASGSGVKIICVDDAAGPVDAVFAIDNEAAGRAAGELMLETLKNRGITSGVVGVIGLDSQACALRASGFRSVFAGEAYTLMDTLISEDDGKSFAFVAGNYLNSDVKALFCCNEDATLGAGQAMKKTNARTLVMGFGQSETVKKLVEDRIVQAALVQDYETMGYQAVMAALSDDVLSGELADTGISVLEAEIPPMEELLTGDFSGYRIAMIAMDRIGLNAYLGEGAKMAAEELGCEVVDLTPVFRSEEEQVKQIGLAVSEGYDAIMIEAIASDAVQAALQEAVSAGVKIVCMGDPAGVGEAVTVAMDHEAAGKTAGELMIAELEAQSIKEGTVGIIGTVAEDPAALQRETGFRSVFEGTAYEVVQTQYAQGDAALAHLIAYAYIENGVSGIFGSTEAAVIGAGNAVEQKRADVTVVGFGTTEKIQEMIDSGVVLASVVQNPGYMGYESVRAACAVLRGAELEDGIHWIDPYIVTK